MHRIRANIVHELANNSRIDPTTNNNSNHLATSPNVRAAKLLSSYGAAMHSTQPSMEQLEESGNNDFYMESSQATIFGEATTKLISNVSTSAAIHSRNTTTTTVGVATATKAIKFISKENENDARNTNKSIAKATKIKTTKATSSPAFNSIEATNPPTTATMKILNECMTTQRQQPQKSERQQLEQQILINTSEFNQINLKSSPSYNAKLNNKSSNNNLPQQNNSTNSNSQYTYNHNENYKNKKSKRPTITSTTTTMIATKATTTATATATTTAILDGTIKTIVTAATTTKASASASASAPTLVPSSTANATLPAESVKIMTTVRAQTTERPKSAAPTLCGIGASLTTLQLNDVASKQDSSGSNCNYDNNKQNSDGNSGARNRVCCKQLDYDSGDGVGVGVGVGGDDDGGGGSNVRRVFTEASNQSVATTTSATTTNAKITNATIETTTATMIAPTVNGVTQVQLLQQQQQQQQKTATSQWVKANTTNDDNQAIADNNAIAGIACAEQSKVVSLDLDQRFGCAHYKRRAMFVTPCCNKFYKCRFCHDENEGHHFDRKTLTELICSECNTRQKVQEQCEHCGTRFGKYTCLICNLFDDTDKKQYHCHGCGICRIGGAENFFHCAVCDMCLPIRLKIDGHRCVENISRSHCPVCLGDIHTSRIPCHIPDCGHLLHKTCFDELLKSGHYTCPICQTSLIDMTTLWEYLDTQAVSLPIPKKYENQRIHIFCNDCHKTSKTKFNFIGLKCLQCGAYNTTQDVKRRMSLVTDEPSTA